MDSKEEKGDTDFKTMCIKENTKENNKDKPRQCHQYEKKYRRDRRENRIVKQFLLITIVYLICFIPQNIGIAFNALIGRYLFYANQICNPIIYFIVDDSFRKKLISLLKPQPNKYRR